MAKYKLLHIPTGRYVVQIKDNINDRRGTYWFEGSFYSTIDLEVEPEAIKISTFKQRRIFDNMLHDLAIDLCTDCEYLDIAEFAWIKEDD